MDPKQSEALLIKKIREGDKYAFEIAFLKYYTPMCKYIWKYVRSEVLAEEIIQEVFVTVWETRFNLDPAGHLRGLLYEMARNKALDYIKHQRIVDQYISEAKQKFQGVTHTPFDVEVSDHKPLVDDVGQAINELPPKARQIFKLNREEGLTYIEIAGYLDISVKTVESHMRRVLIILRERLSKYLSLFILLSYWIGH